MNRQKNPKAILSRMRAMARHGWVYAVYLSGGLGRAKRRIRLMDGSVVITLHRVLPEAERRKTFSPPGMIMSTGTFASMVKHLAGHRVFRVEAPQDSPGDDKRVPIGITFDDGWADNARYAQPILAAHGVTATIFICPEKLGQNLPFWPERLIALLRNVRPDRRRELVDAINEFVQPSDNKAIEDTLAIVEAVKKLSSSERAALFVRLQRDGFSTDAGSPASIDATMDWNDVRRLSKAGIGFGSHSLQHEILTRVPAEEARREITDSRQRLTEELSGGCVAFAYPNGEWSAKVRELVASAGYDFGFANSPGVWRADTDRLTVPRINLWEGAVTGAFGRFSRIHFEYVVFWRTLRNAQKSVDHVRVVNRDRRGEASLEAA